jgi:hypothetical protein
MYDTYEIITAILATPAAILGVMDITGRVRVILDDSHKLKMLRKNPIGDDIEQRFYVKSTHAKYIMGEGSSELTKLRVIRALKNVNKLRIDLAPVYIDETDPGAIRPSPVKQECFSMPGVALRRDKYYQVNLAADLIFEAKADYTYLTSIKILQALDKIHDNPNEDFIQIDKPLGTEKFVAEVQFPTTRKLKKNNNKVQLAVSYVRGSNLEKVDSTKFIVNADDAIETIPGTFTDMFRLTLLHPPQDAGIQIKWQSKVG